MAPKCESLGRAPVDNEDLYSLPGASVDRILPHWMSFVRNVSDFPI